MYCTLRSTDICVCCVFFQEVYRYVCQFLRMNIHKWCPFHMFSPNLNLARCITRESNNHDNLIVIGNTSNLHKQTHPTCWIKSNQPKDSQVGAETNAFHNTAVTVAGRDSDIADTVLDNIFVKKKYTGLFSYYQVMLCVTRFSTCTQSEHITILHRIS